MICHWVDMPYNLHVIYNPIYKPSGGGDSLWTAIPFSQVDNLGEDSVVGWSVSAAVVPPSLAAGWHLPKRFFCAGTTHPLWGHLTVPQTMGTGELENKHTYKRGLTYG